MDNEVYCALIVLSIITQVSVERERKIDISRTDDRNKRVHKRYKLRLIGTVLTGAGDPFMTIIVSTITRVLQCGHNTIYDRHKIL